MGRFVLPAKVTTDINRYLFNSAGACVLVFSANNVTVADNGFENITAGFGASGGTVTGRMMGCTSAGTNPTLEAQAFRDGSERA